MSLHDFIEQLSFTLDDFQIDAMRIIEQGESVVVCAPTGSGKTMIAEFAANEAIEQGRHLFYTTPLKALSNQKFLDLKARYGEDNVGLLTGDISINRDARLVVMTTEVFRNMLYGIDTDVRLFDKLGYVILDECHFMNDSERGTVWEESMIYCPNHVQIVALSATVANSEELTAWINAIHPTTKLVTTSFRPVPLRFSYFNREDLLPLFEAPGKLNKKLKLEIKGNKPTKNLRQFSPNVLLQEMHERDMLPAIFFTFSRRGCDTYLRETRNLTLLSDLDKARIRVQIEQFLEQNPFFADHPMMNWIRNGFASHHAGLLPGIKLLVESLFQQGLIKAVFATETLAAGINMPARSTVITSLTKPTGSGHRMLTNSEFLQMAGRAGRRGMDEVGYVVIVGSQFYGANDAAALASSQADPLNSQFTPTYGMVLNLLQRHTIETAEALIRRSFGQFTSERRGEPIRQALNEKQAKLDKNKAFACPYGVSDDDFHSYLKTFETRSQTTKLLKTLYKQTTLHGKTPELTEEITRQETLRTQLHTAVNESPCRQCKLVHKHQQVEQNIVNLNKQIARLEKDYEAEKNVYWTSFLNHFNLLKEVGHLDEKNQPTEKGEITAQLRHENELVLTEILTRGTLDGLKPQQLAAVVCALVNDSTRENIGTNLRYSPQARQSMDQALSVIKQVHRWQKNHNIDTDILFEPVMSGLIEAWAVGLTWDECIQSTNLDAGDIVRLMRRTIDLLRQIIRIDQLPFSLRQTAQQAINLIYRDPITEIDPIQNADLAE